MLTRLDCEVKKSIDCKPVTRDVCQTIDWTEYEQEIVPVCKNVTCFYPEQVKEHLQKCLVHGTSPLDPSVLGPLNPGEAPPPGSVQQLGDTAAFQQHQFQQQQIRQQHFRQQIFN